MNLNRINGKRIGRNAPCPCGSHRKYKHCHLKFVNKKKQDRVVEFNRRQEFNAMMQQANRHPNMQPKGSDASTGNVTTTSATGVTQ